MRTNQLATLLASTRQHPSEKPTEPRETMWGIGRARPQAVSQGSGGKMKVPLPHSAQGEKSSCSNVGFGNAKHDRKHFFNLHWAKDSSIWVTIQFLVANLCFRYSLPICNLLHPSGRLFALTKISKVSTDHVKYSRKEIQLCTWDEISLWKHWIFSSMSTIVCALWLIDLQSILPSANFISKRGSRKLRMHASVYPSIICFHIVYLWALWFIRAVSILKSTG